MKSTRSTTGEKYSNFSYDTLMLLNEKLTSDDFTAVKFLCSDIIKKKTISKLPRAPEVLSEVGKKLLLLLSLLKYITIPIFKT